MHIRSHIIINYAGYIIRNLKIIIIYEFRKTNYGLYNIIYHIIMFEQSLNIIFLFPPDKLIRIINFDESVSTKLTTYYYH